MLAIHKFDPYYQNSSGTLKYVLEHFNINDKFCIDLPSGNGRNTFLLSNYFETTLCIDNNNEYLEEIRATIPIYNIENTIQTECLDILNSDIQKLDKADFICNVHFYNFSFLKKAIKVMKKNALLFLETPECKGDIFLNLPSDKEIAYLLDNHEILFIKKIECRKQKDVGVAFNLKILLKK